MKNFSQKIFEASVIGAVWLTIGMGLGFVITYNLLRPQIEAGNEAHRAGYREVALDCSKLLNSIENEGR